MLCMFVIATRVLLWMIRASIVLIGLNLFTVIVGCGIGPLRHANRALSRNRANYP